MSTFCNYWNKVSLVKSKIKKSKKIDSIGIGLASPEEIRRWGERRLPNGTLIGKVDKDHTVDYESLKPIEGGLFCERIFGPVEDFYCSCERKGEKNEKFCPNCEVEFTKSRVRRIRMGYIPLAVPVVHVWYLRGRPSYIANLVGKSRNSIDRLAYGETLSESFIGYSSLESIYKKEEQFFPKRIQRILANPCASHGVFPHISFPDKCSDKSSSLNPLQIEDLSGNEMCGKTPCEAQGLATGLRKDNTNTKDGTVAHTLYTPSNAYPCEAQGYKSTICNPKGKLVKAFRFVRRWVTSNPDTTLSYKSKIARTLLQRKPLPNSEGISRASTTTICASRPSKNDNVILYSKRNFLQVAKLTPCKPYKSEICMGTGGLRLEDLSEDLSGIVLDKYKSTYKSSICTCKKIYKKWNPFAIARLNLPAFSPSGLTQLGKQRRSCIAQGSGAKVLNSKVFGSEPTHFIPLQIEDPTLRYGVKEQKYFKCHTLPLFSTFVYKEWSHRFSFLEYFIWSARNNDLILPFYAYQNSRSEKRLANICESIRKNSINLIKNKFSLRFSNKSDSNHSSTRILSNEAAGPLVLQKQKTRLHFLQLRNKQSALRFINVNKNIDFLFYTKPNSSDIRIPPSEPTRYIPFNDALVEAFRFNMRVSYPFQIEDLSGVSAAKNVKASDLAQRRRGSSHAMPFSLLSTDPPRGYVSALALAEGKDSYNNFLANHYKSSYKWQRSVGSPTLRYLNSLQAERLTPDTSSIYKGLRLEYLSEDLYGNEMFALHGQTPCKPEGTGGLATCKIRCRPPSTAPAPRFSMRMKGKAACTYPTHTPPGISYSKSKTLLLGNSEGISCVSSLQQKGWNFRGTLERKISLRLPRTQIARIHSCDNEKVNCVNEGSAASESNAPLYAFSTMQQNTESTLLNKMDTQQFPRLTELLNFTGGAALRNLLSRFDLIVLSRFLRHELKNLELKVNSLLALKMLTYSQGLLLGKLAKRRSKQIRRLKLLELFQSQKSNPEWMILSIIPVLPPDLRPILRVNDDFVVASDLNRLYQTVLRRNNTIHERLDDPLPCPESGLFRQRSLQKAVDGLLENGKGGGTPLCASKRRPLVSLSHVLKGKKGLFRQHLLGKRVDYSGRSVIVVGPRLQLHECGLPKEMAIELFQPFLLHRLKVKGLATSNTTARRMIQQENPVIWHLLKQLVYEHPVLLNRAPTLHRLGIQAFQPRLVSGRAILLHPLVCNGFNADFDGDQMAVHVPLSFQARAEAWKIMWSKNNFLSPATGQPILVPSQDMVLGCYYLSVSIPRILNANVNLVSHDKAMTNGSFTGTTLELLAQRRRGNPKGMCASDFTNLNGTSIAQRLTSSAADPARSSGVNALFTNLRTLTPELRAGSAALSKVQNKALHSKAFLNENKGQYFSNLQDSLLAYFQGRLQTHTPFWVRIDHKFVSRRFATPDKFSSLNPKGISMPMRSSGSPQTNLLISSEAYPVQAGGYWGVKARRFVRKADASLPSMRVGGTATCKGLRSNHNVQYASPVNSIDNYAPLKASKASELTFLRPLYGSSREICKTLFQNKSTNNSDAPLIRVEANETLESPLELRLSVDGNLANILTMFQNHYNYNATWVKQCKEESIKYMRTTAGRVVINNAVFKDF